MFIEITNEVANLAVEKDIELNNPASEIINMVLESMRKRKHIVFIDRVSINVLLQCNSIDNKSKLMLKWISNNLNDLNSIKKKLTTYIVITTGDQSYKKDNIYYFSILEKIEFIETQLLTENDEDYNFYKDIFTFINDDIVCDICLENNPFYGSNVASRIENVYLERKIFLCVVDSDKSYESQAKGDTYKSANSKMKECGGFNPPRELYVLNVREKENLFPFNQYLNFCPSQKEFIKAIISEANEESFRFIKIKEGIKKKYILSKEGKYYELYKGVFDKCKQKGILIESVSDKEYCIKGINADALKLASKDFFFKYSNKR